MTRYWHTLLSVQKFLADKNTTVVFPLTPYSLDLAPRNFFSFVKMKLQLYGHHFQNVLKFRNNCCPSYTLFQNSVPAMVPAQAETLNKLHKLRR
jgi:hypothetical protein